MLTLTARRLLTLTITGAALVSAVPGRASAATITVNTPADAVADDGHCSLREAITSANDDAAPFASSGECVPGLGSDTIEVPAGTYVLAIAPVVGDDNASGDLDIGGPTTVSGAGATVTTIDANGIDRGVRVLPGATATIQDVTISGGHAPNGGDGVSRIGPPGSDGDGDSGDPGQEGGGIRNDGTLTVLDSIITDNTAGAGGTGGNGTGGTGSTSTAGGDGGDGAAGTGGRGGSGGGVFTGGAALTLIRTVVANNAAGAGGAGGSGFGGQGGAAITGLAGHGGRGIGEYGGDGGTGGGIAQAGAGNLAVLQSAITGNAAGSGGTGGSGQGGFGGGSGGTEGGDGGHGFGGDGGAGGDGGGIAAAATVNLTDDLVAGNAAGNAGDAASGTGGTGGADGGTNGQAGSGGDADGGVGGTGGVGGGFSAPGVLATNDTVTDNTDGSGSAGGRATGGNGGPILATGQNGDGGNASGGPSGDGGSGGGFWLGDRASTLTHATITLNAVAPAGSPGVGVGGAAGTGGARGVPGTSSNGQPGKPGGGGGAFTAGVAMLQNSIVADNTNPSCDGGFGDGGHLIAFPDAACPGSDIDPQLAPLADNGGPTETQALDPGSPAIDAVPAFGGNCAATDQRGVSRPVGSACDIGAYEHAPPTVTPSATTAISLGAATLGGLLTTNARTTGYHFEYGETAGYGSSTVVQDAAAGVTPAPVTAAIGGLSPGTTYHYRLVASNADGTTDGADQTFTTTTESPAPAGGNGGGGGAGGGGGGGAGGGSAPRFLSASVHPKVFAVDRRGRPRKGARRHTPRGTTFRMRLSEAARISFTIEQVVAGRRVGRSCRPQTRADHKRRRCVRFVKSRRFSVNAIAGQNARKFSGRIGRGALAPGNYRATLVATDAARRRSAARRLSFRVVAG